MQLYKVLLRLRRRLIHISARNSATALKLAHIIYSPEWYAIEANKA